MGPRSRGDEVSDCSRHQAERHPARDRTRRPTPCSPSPWPHRRTFATSATLNVSPLIRSLAPLTKRKPALGSFSSGSPLALLLTAMPDDLPPVLGQPLRIRALHLDSGQRLRHILADRLLPVRTGRRIGAQNIVAAVGVVELDEGRAAVARVQLHAVIGRMRDHVGGAHADRRWRACRARRDRRSRRSPCSRRGRRSCRESVPPRCPAGTAPPLPAGWCRPAAARSPGRIWRRCRRGNRRSRPMISAISEITGSRCGATRQICRSRR